MPDQAVLNRIGELKIIPVISIEKVDDASPLGDALVDGGLPIAEITFRTTAAEACIRKLAPRKEMLVGAGTVLNVDTAKLAVDAAPASSSRPVSIPKSSVGALTTRFPSRPAPPLQRTSKWPSIMD